MISSSEIPSLNKLNDYFKAYFPLNHTEHFELSSRFSERSVKRRQFILQQGDVCRHFSFVVSGCFKMYAVDQSGKEHNIQFASENEWIFDLASFYSQNPSKLNIEAIEPGLILQIKHADLLYLFTNHHKFNRNFRIIIEQKFIELQNRVLDNISSTTQDRYLTFLQQYPNLSNRLPNTQIASYLGITPEFLSKIRKDIAQKS